MSQWSGFWPRRFPFACSIPSRTTFLMSEGSTISFSLVCDITKVSTRSRPPLTTQRLPPPFSLESCPFFLGNAATPLELSSRRPSPATFPPALWSPRRPSPPAPAAPVDRDAFPGRSSVRPAKITTASLRLGDHGHGHPLPSPFSLPSACSAGTLLWPKIATVPLSSGHPAFFQLGRFLSLFSLRSRPPPPPSAYLTLLNLCDRSAGFGRR